MRWSVLSRRMDSTIRERMNLADFQPGQPMPIAPGVQRLVAPNASPMTGPGTNSYLIGDPVWAVIDPGPDDDRHLAAIRAAAPAITTIFVTHTHRDHSPLARRLALATGAAIVGRKAPQDGRQDTGFVPDRQPQADEVFRQGEAALQAIHTPGHASNHVCYLLQGEAMLFSGDHILDGVTPVILAPDGDMADYLAALRDLRGRHILRIAPGHGRVLEAPVAVIDGVIAHRLRREALILQALRDVGRSDAPALVTTVYHDTPQALHGMARLTLEAHLIKLEREGLVRRELDIWHAA
jgi:glyoxylase-like metal-dependent hydrolase (beta-lactamase superfamily II)